jgi:GntR family transcriptional regulator
MTSSEEAITLNISRNQPVVEMDRWIWGVYKNNPGEEALFEHSKIVANAHFTYSYSIDESATR